MSVPLLGSVLVLMPGSVLVVPLRLVFVGELGLCVDVRTVVPMTRPMTMLMKVSPAVPALVVLVLRHNSRLSHPRETAALSGCCTTLAPSHPPRLTEHVPPKHVRHEHVRRTATAQGYPAGRRPRAGHNERVRHERHRAGSWAAPTNAFVANTAAASAATQTPPGACHRTNTAVTNAFVANRVGARPHKRGLNERVRYERGCESLATSVLANTFVTNGFHGCAGIQTWPAHISGAAAAASRVAGNG
ncbi:hypothetical protein [Dactylosporangium sp. CA-139066]|uniref:hypothetical protein n=1 Tax=Dactylosporangium sp. CA-139066 TaxID=3239930 RepID=UPI003D8CC19A